MTDIFVKLMDLPCSVRGFTKKHAKGCTIVLNSRMSREQNIITYKHELKHISEGHLDREVNVQEVESELHGL